MILQTVLSIIVAMILISFFKVILPMRMMQTKRDCIFWIFEKVFDIYPEERQTLFPPNHPQEITCGKIRLTFSNMEEACTEFEKYINELIHYYEMHSWIVNADPDLQLSKERLKEIKERIVWLRRRS